MNDLLLRIGEYDMSGVSEPHEHQDRKLQLIEMHPQFDHRTYENDLALLK